MQIICIQQTTNLIFFKGMFVNNKNYTKWFFSAFSTSGIEVALEHDERIDVPFWYI